MDVGARRKLVGEKTASKGKRTHLPSESKKTTATPLSPTLRRRLEEIASVEREKESQKRIHKKHAWEEEEVGIESEEKTLISSKIPPTPSWLFSRMFLTGEFILSKGRSSSYPTIGSDAAAPSMKDFPSHVQEVVVVEELLNELLGFEGQMVEATEKLVPKAGSKAGGSGFPVSFKFQEGLDQSVSDLVERILPLGAYFRRVHWFVHDRFDYGYGLVNHAFTAVLRELMKDYMIFVAQLETMFREKKLSLHKLWFFVQPALKTMELLDSVVKDVVSKEGEGRGGALLNILLRWNGQLRGDPVARDVMGHLLTRASVPYFSMLEKWIYEGIIEDPYDEFMIREDDGIEKGLSAADIGDLYWRKRYSCRREQFPVFLEKVSEKVLTTGKFLNVVRECGRPIDCPVASSLSYTTNDREYVEKIDEAFGFASSLLLRLFMDDMCLMQRLESLKHYFMLEHGDFVFHFMDSADEELQKPVRDISLSKLESLLELSVRTSISVSDPYKESLTCVLLKEPLRQQLPKIFATGSSAIPELKKTSLDPLALSGLEAFSLEQKVEWPISLVLNRTVMTRYQIIFRHLFYCKYVERQLCSTWAGQQSLKEYSAHSLLLNVFSLRRKMLHFLQNYEYYMMVEVIEPNWHRFEAKIENVKTIEEVMSCLSDFLDNCLKACLLTNTFLINRLYKILHVCSDFSRSMTTFYRSFSVRESSSSGGIVDLDSRGSGKDSPVARAAHSEYMSAHIKTALSDSNFKKIVVRKEADFHENIMGLLKSLNEHAHSTAGDTHLDHLCTRLDYNLYYKNTLLS